VNSNGYAGNRTNGRRRFANIHRGFDDVWPLSDPEIRRRRLDTGRRVKILPAVIRAMRTAVPAGTMDRAGCSEAQADKVAKVTDIFERFGVARIINGTGTVTRLGASPMDAEVIAAMSAAATWSVDIADLQGRACEVISTCTGAEAGIVTTIMGCAPLGPVWSK
jgi:hypothetical protein